MLKRLRKAHPILFCVLAEVIFLASLFCNRSWSFTICIGFFSGRILRPLIHTSTALCRTGGGHGGSAVSGTDRPCRAAAPPRQRLFQWPAGGHVPLVFIGYNAFGSLVLGRPENGVLQPAARICTFLSAWPWWVWPRNSSSAVSLPRPCWSTLAPAAPVCGRPAFCPVCCLVRRT